MEGASRYPRLFLSRTRHGMGCDSARELDRGLETSLHSSDAQLITTCFNPSRRANQIQRQRGYPHVTLHKDLSPGHAVCPYSMAAKVHSFMVSRMRSVNLLILHLQQQRLMLKLGYCTVSTHIPPVLLTRTVRRKQSYQRYGKQRIATRKMDQPNFQHLSSGSPAGYPSIL